MSAHLDKLMMQVALIDQVTKPLKGIQKTVTQTTDVGRAGWERMAGGTAGVIASGFAIQQALMPAIEMDRVLGEVKSLGVIDADLQKLQQTALSFSAEYGKSAEEVVGAAYDIKSAFGGINGDELADITKSSAVLAAATKADTATITNYMGTMYGVFKNQADAMGVGIWSEQVAGMTAQSVEMFKTTGKGMSDAFTAVGANATAAGIKMNEQMAVLGTLQATMSGSEAGTKYRAFLAGVGKAQDALNMKFTDAQGNMLPMLDILNQLKSRYGDTFDVAESLQLDKAFGTKEATAMIKLLMADTSGLAKSIDRLGQVKGMTKAEQMASAMTDQWERLDASWYAIRAGAFGLILPAINSVAGSMADGFTVLLAWTQQFPELTSYISYAALAIVAGAGALAAWNVVAGIGRIVAAGVTGTFGLLRGSVLGLAKAYNWAKRTLVIFSVYMKASGISTAVSAAITRAYSVSVAMMQGALMGTAKGLLWLTASVWRFTAALLANPVTWIVVGIVGLTAAVVGLIYYWDELTAYIANSAAWQKLVNWFGVVKAWFSDLMVSMQMAWQMFTLAIQSTTIFQWLNTAFNSVIKGWQGVTSFLSDLSVFDLLGESINWLIEKINLIPGIEIEPVFKGAELTKTAQTGQGVMSAAIQPAIMPQPEPLQYSAPYYAVSQPIHQPGSFSYQTPELLNYPNMNQTVPDQSIEVQRAERIKQPVFEYTQTQRRVDVPNGGYMSQMANAGKADNSRTMHTGDITIKQEQPFTPDQLAQWMEMDTP